jgi:hypothetical protein
VISTHFAGNQDPGGGAIEGGSGRALTVGDFDEDGVPDLVVAVALRTGGVLVLHRGNPDAIYPAAPGAKQRKAAGQMTHDAFFSPPRIFATVFGADSLVAGDFDADGHLDLLAASIGFDAMYLHHGDGTGGFAAAEPVQLPGHLDAIATGEVNRRDGLTDVVVAVRTDDGSKVLIYEHPTGAFAQEPESVAVDTEVVGLALGQIDGRPGNDLVIGTSGYLEIIHGRNRYAAGRATSRPDVSTLRMPFSVVAVAVGDFAAQSPNRDDLAVVNQDGDIHLVAKVDTEDFPLDVSVGREGREGWTLLDARGWRVSRQVGRLDDSRLSDGRLSLVQARVTGSHIDDLIALGSPGDGLQIVSADGHAMEHIKAEAPMMNAPVSLVIADSRSRTTPKRFIESNDGRLPEPIAPSMSTTALPLMASPTAVVSMRLDGDAIDDLVVLVGGRSDPLVIRAKAAETVIVSTTSDVVDGDTSSISSLNTTPGGDGVISLREAITAANNTTGADTINFDIPVDTDPGCDIGSGVCTIQPGGLGLPTITQPVTIDGMTQPSFQTTPVIEIDGSLATVDATGIAITAGSSTIRGLVINRFAGNSDIVMWGAGGNIVEGCFLGVDAGGTFNRGTTNSVHVFAISNNTIGGTTAAARNVISGNSNPAVALNAGASNNLVQGNFIGTDVTGTVALGNSGNDIVTLDSPDNTIGGTEAGAGNLVSGNLDPDFASIGLGFPASTGNLVQGNLVGTDVNGTADLGGASIGVYVAEGSGNTVGGTSPSASNLISGGDSTGVGIAAASGNTVQGNFVGTQIDGATPLPNSSHGVLIYAGASNNLVGGRVPGARNVIANNGASGVDLRGDAGSGNTVVGNDVFGNTDLGINFCADYDDVGMVCNDDTAVNPNDPDDPDTGSNDLQNHPDVTSVQDGPVIEGTLDSIADSEFIIDFYASSVCDPSGNGEGETYLGSETVMTDANGDVSFTASLTATLTNGWFVTATATDVNGSTSEFSACRAFESDAIFVDGFESGDTSAWTTTEP